MKNQLSLVLHLGYVYLVILMLCTPSHSAAKLQPTTHLVEKRSPTLALIFMHDPKGCRSEPEYLAAKDAVYLKAWADRLHKTVLSTRCDTVTVQSMHGGQLQYEFDGETNHVGDCDVKLKLSDSNGSSEAEHVRIWSRNTGFLCISFYIWNLQILLFSYGQFLNV